MGEVDEGGRAPFQVEKLEADRSVLGHDPVHAMLRNGDARSERVPSRDVRDLSSVAQGRGRMKAEDALSFRRELRSIGKLKGAAEAAVGLWAYAVGAGLAAQIDVQDTVDAGHP